MSRIKEIQGWADYFDFQADMANDEARETYDYDPEYSKRTMEISNAAWAAKFAIEQYLGILRSGQDREV